ncbi:radical SAM protein [Romboutsia lituseburensis]|uniref:radical SAM protein n=1 Tax=Romboutsia lituseburensis TaxID=1537 RepID=UPI00215AA6C1|nr:radical SAM protein [Romboutsia lituseburensis]MCR8746702.1 radical SAM protein [Romboutsia lituseburensis]
MKWKNKGHEFDDFIREWDINKEYYIWGASNSGNRFFDKFKDILNIKGFIDSDESKHNHKIANKSIVTFEHVKSNYPKTKIIIASQAYYEISNILKREGYIENVDFCNGNTFTATYFMYNHNKLYLHRIDISLTNRCTLKCKKCNMLMPYFEKPMHKSLSSIKENIDLYFKWVDNVETIKLLGGEPMLYPYLIDVIEYLNEEYKDRIDNIDIFSNGTLKLSNEILTTLKRHKVTVQISDYSNRLEYLKEKVDLFEAQLKNNEITYTRLTYDKWLDFIQQNYHSIDSTQEELVDKFNKCNPPFRGLHDKKLYYCHLSTSAVQAEIFEDNNNDYFDLSRYNENRKIELMEFDLGYNEIGYVTYCKRCNGCESVNNRFTNVAEQVKR